jgi:hypothetical protein
MNKNAQNAVVTAYKNGDINEVIKTTNVKIVYTVFKTKEDQIIMNGKKNYGKNMLTIGKP